ncbi:MAG TPA: c-type cytochrome, partial [Verrucomicrobiales bacterium]|nr:c-type cytochrome [Verrucomicrobiales bacterium]
TEGTWANAALLALASRTGGSPESREMSQKAIHLGWNSPVQKAVLIEAAALTGNHSLDDRIRFAVDDANPTVSKAAITAAKKLKLQPKGEDKTPLIASLSPEKALETALAHSGGDIALGEAVFSKATCIACHTVSQDQQQKGPYLGTIFETYKRPEIALAILDPNKTIAQGFATNVLTLKDGSTQMGFITDEQGEQLTLRDIAAQEHVINKASIIKRETLPTSMMPPGLLAGFTVHEMGSLLDYLESLGKKKASP